MNDFRPDPADELLSAYFDGEVTAEELARVEVLRNTSPAAAAELEGYAELSHSLKALPRNPAPPEIRAAVMRVAEQSALLKAPSVVNRHSLLRELAIAVVAASATAAAMFLALLPSSQPGERELHLARATRELDDRAVVYSTPSAAVVADRDARDFGLTPHLSTTARTARANTNALHDVDGLQGASELRKEISDAPSDFTRGVNFGNDTPLRRGDDSGATEKKAMNERSRPAPSQAEGLVRDPVADANVKADQVQIGDALRYLSPTDNYRYVSNVDIFVTDVERFAGQMQTELNQNGVPLLPTDVAKHSSTPASKSARTTKLAAPEAELLAIYVDAPTEPVARALDQLAQQPEMVGVKLRPPLELPVEFFKNYTNTESSETAQPVDIEQRLKISFFSNYQNEYIANVEWSDGSVSAVDHLQNQPEDAASQIAGNSASKPGPRAGQPSPNRFRQSNPTTAPLSPITLDETLQNGYNRKILIPIANNTNPVADRPTSNTLTGNSTQLPPGDAYKLQQQAQSNLSNNRRVLFVLQQSNFGANSNAPRSMPGELKPAAPPASPRGNK